MPGGKSSADGTFSIPHLRGTLTVMVRHEGFLARKIALEEVGRLGEKELALGDLALEPAGP